jgi:hypothetical protein
MREARYTVHAITSSWRPNRVLTNLATKVLAKLPAEFRNAKPDYWFAIGRPPRPSAYRETVYLARHYTMASLWNGSDREASRFGLVARGRRGATVFTGGHPTGHQYATGYGKYDQSAQAGPVYILMSRIPPTDPLPYAFFTLPEGAGEPIERDGWFFLKAGSTLVAVHGLGDAATVGRSDLAPEQVAENERLAADDQPLAHVPIRILRFEGRQTGFVVQLADTDRYASVEAFMSSIKRWVKLDTSKWTAEGTVAFTGLDGLSVTATYRDGKDAAAVTVNGQAVRTDSRWPVYSGPYVAQEGGVLTVNDGREGFVVDFTGDLPEYRPWRR